MIRFEFSALQDSPYFNCDSNGTISRYGSTPPPEWAAEAYFLMCWDTPAEEVGVVERAVGNRPIHDERVYGTMRDKGVKHLNARGTVSLPSSTYVGQLDPLYGVPMAYTESTQTWSYTGYPRCWGDESRVSRSLPSYEFVSGGVTYAVDASYGEWFLRFQNDCFIIVAELYNPRVVRKSTGKVQFYASRRGAMRGYRRKLVNGSKKLEYWTDFQYSEGDHFTGTEQLAYLTLCENKASGQLQNQVAYQVVSHGDTSELADSLTERIRQHLTRSSLHLDEHPVDFGELALECSQQMKFVDQNLLLLVFDVDDWTHIHRLWKSLRNSRGWKLALQAYKRVKKGIGTRRDIAEMFNPASSMYLFGKYAVLPSVSDIGRLFDGAKRSSLYLHKQRLHSRRVTPIDDPSVLSATHTAVITVQCDSYPTSVTGSLQWAMGEGKKWGAFPEVQNLWDMLPYSFVVDWIVQFGDLFEDVDQWLNQKYYFPIQHCVMSEKWEVSKSINSIAPEYPAEGVVYFSYYVRWISRELPLPTVSLSAESTAGSHLLESTALVLQRL